jgi:enterochelin esterase-like enzyme
VSNYQHIELSSPEFERDGLRFLTFKSPALGRRGDVSLFVPNQAVNKKDIPLALLLHGVYGSHWSWAMNGKAHLTAARLISEGSLPPMMLAMPSDGLFGDGSGYVPHTDADYEKWIIEDVVGCIREVFPFISVTSKLFIAGLSMGGFGALRLGAKYADRFCAVSAHSSLTHLDQLERLVKASLTDNIGLSEETVSVFYWLKQNREILPPVRFDCGIYDELIEENRELHRNLQTSDIMHQYFEFSGGHTWDYWQEHLKDTLLFFASK